LAVAIVVLIVAVIGVLSFRVSSNRQGESSTVQSVQGQTESSSSVVSPNGLALQIALNSSAVRGNEAITAEIFLRNTQDISLTFAPNFNNPTILDWDGHDNLCGLSPVHHLVGYALFQGYYTSANISEAAEPLNLIPPVAIPCPYSHYGESNIHAVVFLPQSSIAELLGNASITVPIGNLTMKLDAVTSRCSSQPYQATINGHSTIQYSFGCGPDNSLYGYWTPPMNLTCSLPTRGNGTLVVGPVDQYCNFHRFQAGSYTIAARDVWNDTAFGYFEVT